MYAANASRSSSTHATVVTMSELCVLEAEELGETHPRLYGFGCRCGDVIVIDGSELHVVGCCGVRFIMVYRDYTVCCHVLETA